ncbi:RDD family protein [Flavobacterium sp.]|uniref:RDD family protein n=1 Tax=Flavobacterium sp. TaxID=239 RepID=UPI00374D6FF7
MKKTILVISFIFSFLGLLCSFIFIFFEFKDITAFVNFVTFSTEPYAFQGMDIYIPRYVVGGFSDNSSVSLGLINLFLYLSFLAGTIIYYISKYKENRLLIFNFSLIFLNSIIKILLFLIFFNQNKNDSYQFPSLIITLIYIFMSYHFITKHLNFQDNNLAYNNNQSVDNDLETASNFKRFLNLIIDNSLIIVIMFSFLATEKYSDSLKSFFNAFRSIFGERFSSFAFFYLIKFIYYLTLEAVFKATPAKFLTGCYITDEEGKEPSLSMIFKRTLYRFIPFEPFSVFVGRFLHDDYSQTYVINKKSDSSTDNRYLQFLGIGFVFTIVIYIYDLFIHSSFH